MELNTDQYFADARERYQIKLFRDAKMPPPWSTKPEFVQWRLCNVHREDDKTTIWFRDNVRSKLSGYDVLQATVIFRWFNRIETGETIKDLLLEEWDSKEAYGRLQDVRPVVTGAYIIKGADGYTKLDGVLKCVDAALPNLAMMYYRWGPSSTLEEVWKDLCSVWYLGKFMAYEIVSDLRWTDVLCDAPDILTWANIGPGCRRGLGWIVGRNPQHFSWSKNDQMQMREVMQELLHRAREGVHWPQQWAEWEMREVEHWCCEYDKLCRARSGARLKRRYTPAVEKMRPWTGESVALTDTEQ